MLKSTVTLQAALSCLLTARLLSREMDPELRRMNGSSLLFELGPKLISDIRRDTVSFDIGAKLSAIPIIILHILHGRQNQCFGNCMGFAKLSNSMSNYIRCLQTLLGDGDLLFL